MTEEDDSASNNASLCLGSGMMVKRRKIRPIFLPFEVYLLDPHAVDSLLGIGATSEISLLQCVIDLSDLVNSKRNGRFMDYGVGHRFLGLEVYQVSSFPRTTSVSGCFPALATDGCIATRTTLVIRTWQVARSLDSVSIVRCRLRCL